MYKIISLAVMLLLVCSPAMASDDKALTAKEKGVVTLVEKYVQSINEGNTELGATVWVNSDQASFIHPRGDVRGWENIKNGFYEKTMVGNFSQRKLKIDKMDIQYFDDMAIVLFYWTFDATFRKGGKEIQTKGRETQVFRYVDDRWYLMHVHYSSMPVKAPGQGF